MVDPIKIFVTPVNPEASLEHIFSSALKAATKKGVPIEVKARFYPYAGLSSTIRLRQDCIYVRVSDVLKESPPDVLYALACILITKLYRRKAPVEQEQIYRRYTLQPEVIRASESARRSRGYKIVTTSCGRYFDLKEVFSDLNSRYFSSGLARPLLTWSQQHTRRILGHHDHIHGAIVVSRTLDTDRIPRFVLEYVLYHEMLHVKHPPRLVGTRTIYHSREFRTDERRFEQFHEAVKWLDGNSLPGRRRRKGGRAASSS